MLDPKIKKPRPIEKSGTTGQVQSDIPKQFSTVC